MVETIKTEEKPLEPSEIPTQEQIKRIIGMAHGASGSFLHIRNQAILSCLNDMGLRPTELLSCNLSDVVEESNYLVFNIPQSKTYRRKIVSYLAKPFLKKYFGLRNSMLKSNERDARKIEPLFVDRFGKRLSPKATRMMIIRSFKKAGIGLPENRMIVSKVFRHAFATRAEQHFPHGVFYYWNGWSRGISGTYSHIDYKSCLSHYFKMLQLEKNPMLVLSCPNKKCHHENLNHDHCLAISLEERPSKTNIETLSCLSKISFFDAITNTSTINPIR